MASLVTIATYMDQTEALVARSLLESDEIDCLLLGENQVMAQPYLLTGLQGLRLQVFSPDAPRARELLDIPFNAASDHACPSCGSDRVHRKASLLHALLGFFIAVPVRKTSDKWQCANCRFVWVEEEDED
jgi:predicted RNA-binding Zn-ribbon protein involved in translation (DUF1610 family)